MAKVQTVFMQESPTRLEGSAFNLAQGQFRTFPGGPVGRHRKQIVITNDDNDTRLHVVTATGDPAAPTTARKVMTVFPNTSVTLFTNAPITVMAVDGTVDIPSSTLPAIYVLETFYLGAGEITV